MLYFFVPKSGLAGSPVRLNTPSLPSEIEIRESDDPVFLSVLCKITIAEAIRRLANDHKAFVAFYNHIPAAFGWMAMGKAKIGELNHEIILPLNHRYLWNFRTLEEFRGLGIYPALLQYIISAEAHKAECFWIMHAPENIASQKGIIKAGFTFAGSVSVLKTNEVILGDLEEQYQDMIENAELGFVPSTHEPASCWKCSSPYLAHKKKECCCTMHNKVCNQYLFQ